MPTIYPFPHKSASKPQSAFGKSPQSIRCELSIKALTTTALKNHSIDSKCHNVLHVIINKVLHSRCSNNCASDCMRTKKPPESILKLRNSLSEGNFGIYIGCTSLFQAENNFCFGHKLMA